MLGKYLFASWGDNKLCWVVRCGRTSPLLQRKRINRPLIILNITQSSVRNLILYSIKIIIIKGNILATCEAPVILNIVNIAIVMNEPSELPTSGLATCWQFWGWQLIVIAIVHLWPPKLSTSSRFHLQSWNFFHCGIVQDLELDSRSGGGLA